MRGDLAVGDIPEAWNAEYKEYLGVEVPDNARGCLQDVRWSMCSRLLPGLHARQPVRQFFEKAMADMPDMYAQFEEGSSPVSRLAQDQHSSSWTSLQSR